VTEIPALVAEATDSLNTRGTTPTFVEQVCAICSAAMELGDQGQPTCSQCGMTAAQAEALDGTREEPRQAVTNTAGWYQETPGEREPVTYIDIPKNANNHQAGGQRTAQQADLGMPKRKAKEVATAATSGELKPPEQPQQAQAPNPKKHFRKG